jgi:hypothetical protein
MAAIPKSIPVSNPMHNFATWTYNFSLWWLDVKDYNDLVSDRTPGAINKPLSNSYVIAEQGGMFPTRRLPSTYGLNYNIQDVEFTTVVGLNAQSKSSNIVEGKMTILEPYGVSLIDALISASYNPASQTYENYTDRPFMLQLDFSGRDAGGLIANPELLKLYKKRFPIRIVSVKVEMTQKGTTYTIGFAASGHEAYDKHVVTTPIIFNVTAGTVGEFFTELKNQWNKYYDELWAKKKQIMYCDEVVFDIHPEIRDSKITSDKNTPISEANTNTATKLDTSKKTFTIPQNTSMIDILNKVMAQSDWLQKQLGYAKIDNPTKQDQTRVLSSFKTTALLKYQGRQGSKGQPEQDVFDTKNNRRPKQVTFAVNPYASWNNSHPGSGSAFADPSLNVSKKYDYVYTGKNIDIIELKINFDTAYFVPVLGATESMASQLATASSGADRLATNSPDYQFGQGFFLQMYPQILGGIKNPTPLMTRFITNNQNITIGLKGAGSAAAQKTGDVIESLYSRLSGDMMTPELRIVGDPTLIKQDDWLYTPSANENSYENQSYGKDEGNKFALNYGHIRMDRGDVICQLTINSPLDIDTDITNQGGVFPPPGTVPNTFNGYYRLITIRNTFQNGKFEQYLRMTRYPNSAMVEFLEKRSKQDAATETKDPVKTNQDNQTKTGNTNTLNSSNRDAGIYTAPAGANQETKTAFAQAAGHNYTIVVNDPGATQAQIATALKQYEAASRNAGFGGK